MRLSGDDTKLFFKLYPALLFYVKLKENPIENLVTAEDFMGLPTEEQGKIRNALWENPDLIDSFIEKNPAGFTQEELEIVGGWKDFIQGRFYVVQYLKSYTVFLEESDDRAYGVLGLMSDFYDILGPGLPTFVHTVLLPFRGQIVYDGFLMPFNVIFGSGISRDINDSYQKAKARYGVITSLPFSSQEKDRGGEELLKFYLKNERNRNVYEEEIRDLIDEDPDLLRVYHQEMGKAHARSYGKKLRESGIENAYFAILEGLIIAGAKSRGEVERIIAEIVPPEKLTFVYIFHHAGVMKEKGKREKRL